MIQKTICMKQQDYQYTLIATQLFRHILPYLKVFGSKHNSIDKLKKHTNS